MLMVMSLQRTVCYGRYKRVNACPLDLPANLTAFAT